ncbi:hypothetical protein [Bradyrhizobium sp. AZCC 1721]|uniref:hypothetical protein n=1 Tax=Bradyrhizobium sp. AZCC 1721 TaxID=3117016 RepID=UPI002FF1E317
MPLGKYVIMEAVETSGKVAPFVEYLRGGKPLDNVIRHWLIDALTGGTKNGFRLVPRRKRGGRTISADKFERIRDAHEYYEGLRTRNIDSKLAERCRNALNGKMQIVRGTKAARYGERRIKPAQYVIETRKRVFRLDNGKPPTKYVALALTSKKFGIPQDTLRKQFRQLRGSP